MRLLFLAGVFLLFTHSLSASGIEIGRAVGDSNMITADTAVLCPAIRKTLNDGTTVKHLYIRSSGAFHYLVAEGMNRTFKKMIAIQLVYDINTRTYYATQGAGYVTCAAAACSDCSMFTENGRIIGCKCAEKSTISNQCNFTGKATSGFYLHLAQAIRLKKNQQ